MTQEELQFYEELKENRSKNEYVFDFLFEISNGKAISRKNKAI